jgi:hypothetical protein
MNKKLRADLLEEKYRNERMKARLDKAESLAISLGTPDLGKKRRAAGSLERDDEGSEGATSSDDGEEESDGDEEEDSSSERSSSSSHSGEEGGEQEQQQQPDQVMEPAIDLSVSPTDPVEDGKETSAAPANRLSFKQALEISKKNRSQSAAVSTKAKTDLVPSHRKMITLSSLGTKRDDSANKRTRTALEPTNDQEQPVSKKPPQNSDQEQPVSKKPPQNNDPTPNRQVSSEVAPKRRSRNPEKEEAIEEEVRRSAQNVRWTKGPLPSNIDHWFYDLRDAGTVPPPSLVAASRNMVLAWKAALGRQYFPYSAHAGGSVLSLEHAHRTFKAVTVDMPLAIWTSRACAKHQNLHDTMSIPMLVARNGNPLDSRPCPLIYYYEQLLEDMRHIITHLFEVIPRTILNPIPKAHSRPIPRNIKSTPSNNAAPAATDHYAWRQTKSSRGKKIISSADEHFRELAKDIHESNKNIANPYEQEDTEQYNWAFDSLLSDEKKALVSKTERLIKLIKAGDPPKNYIVRRTSKLKEDHNDKNTHSNRNVAGFYGTTTKEYDEYAIFDLESFIDDIKTNNADKHILGYYEDRSGSYKNITFRDGPSGQGTR